MSQSFPTNFTPNYFEKNKKALAFKRDLAKLRVRIYDHVIMHDADDGFDLTAKGNRDDDEDKDDGDIKMIDKELVKAACGELHALGWATAVAYGQTLLFIYNPKKPLKIPADEGLNEEDEED